MIQSTNDSRSQPAIDVSNLSKTYSEGLLFRRSHHALKNVSLTVNSGEVFGLLGPNGAGKTTLIKILLGILHPNHGDAKVLRLPAGSMSARRKIGYLPENLVFPRHHTGRSALYFYGRLSELSNSQIAAKERELFDLVGLTGRVHEPVRKYSKGMRQRLGLAQAMLHDPDLLILDEPTDGLDPMGRSQIRDVLDQLKQRGKTVFLNSHILQEVELVCDRVAIMALGQLRGLGTIDDLIQQHPQASRATVNLDAIGASESLRKILEALPFAQVKNLEGEPSAAGICRIDIDASVQSNVDHVIDALRENGISIHRMERFRPSLEQVFMSIVGAAMASSTSTNSYSNK